jgi:hypothetical protein
MTMESGRDQGQPPADVDLVRTMALSSAELWHEILERLREVQESQVRLAGAIETLGEMVRDALVPDAQPVLGAHSRGASLARATAPPLGVLPDPGPAAGPVAEPRSFLPPPPVEARVPGPRQSPPDPFPDAPPVPAEAVSEPGPVPPLSPDLEAGSGSIMDALLGFKAPPVPAEGVITSVETSAQRPRSGANEVPEPVLATEVPEPLFYVPPFDEEVLPATSVAHLTPAALDAVLAAEFGVAVPVTNGDGPAPDPGTATHPVGAEPEGASPSTVVESTSPPDALAADAPPTPPIMTSTPAAPPVMAAAPSAPPAMEIAAAAPAHMPVETVPTWSGGSTAAVPVVTDVGTFDGVETIEAAPSPEPSRRRAPVTDPNVILDILLGTRASAATDDPGAEPSDPTALAATPPAAPASAPTLPVEEPRSQAFTAGIPPVGADPATVTTDASPPAPPVPPAPPSASTPDVPPPAPAFAAEVAPPPPPPPVFSGSEDPAAVFSIAPPSESSWEQASSPPPSPPLDSTPGEPEYATGEPAFAAGDPALAAEELPAFATAELPTFAPGEPPAPHLAVPPPPPVGMPPTNDAPVFVDDGAATPFVLPTYDEPSEGAGTESVSGPFTSVASMATEILSATPDIPTVAVPETPESEFISKDVTLIARGRRKRFRLR